MSYEIELAINYQTFDNFKQKPILILQGLFANGRIIDYMKFNSYATITSLDDHNKHILIEEMDKFNRLKTNCIIYDLTYNKYNPGKYDKIFIYTSITSRDTEWYGYVLYNTKTHKTFNKYCISKSDDKLYQYIYLSIINLSEDVKWNYYNKKWDSLKEKKFDEMQTVKHHREMKKYYENLIKAKFDPLEEFILD